jgi:hypothetical protein
VVDRFVRLAAHPAQPAVVRDPRGDLLRRRDAAGEPNATLPAHVRLLRVEASRMYYADRTVLVREYSGGLERAQRVVVRADDCLGHLSGDETTRLV